jgi:trypsin
MKIFLIIFALFPIFASGQANIQIFGGVEAEPGEFPFIVSLRTHATAGESNFCGGSFIKKNWVLTAAHCLDMVTISSLVVGLYDQRDLSKAESFKIRRTIVHPNYTNKLLHDYDFGLIELDGESSFTPIEVSSKDLSVSESSDPINLTTAGWGTTENSSGTADILRKVDVPLVPNSLCAASYPSPLTITDRMMCAGLAEGGKDSCSGDSGGPLILSDGGKKILVGIASWGYYKCGAPKMYGVYSKVSSVYDWIQETIK